MQEDDTRLALWALRQDRATGYLWWELAAGAISSVGVYALLAAAAQPDCTSAEAARIDAAYFPSMCALSTLLDSLVDRERDVRSGELSFVGYYPSRAAAIARLRQLAERALAGVRALPRGERHVVLVTGMIAMHLSEDDAATAGPEPATRALLQATQTPATRLLLAILRAWRRARGLRMRTEHAPADQARGGVCQPLFSPE
jgi:tetraprenyl-beta-curcumene synthase